MRSLKFRRSMQACMSTPAALHDHEPCRSKCLHLPHPQLHARTSAVPQTQCCSSACPCFHGSHAALRTLARPRDLTSCAHTDVPVYMPVPSPALMQRTVSFRIFRYTCFLSSPFPSVIPLASVRNLSYFNLHFTTRSRPGKSLITTAGEYFPESFNILRRSSPWSCPISISRKPSGFRKPAAFSTIAL